MQIPSCFLTGTDTEIGKTHTACTLLHHWKHQGFRAVGYKPVAAGGDWQNGQLVNEDAARLLVAGTPGPSLREVNPICLEAAIAPHVAAAEEGRILSPRSIVQGFEALQKDYQRVVVEGVGGFRVPLGEYFDSADLAQALDLPVILVVGLRLGCINHALLSAEAIQARGLKLFGWIANTLSPEMPRLKENIASLERRLPAPCLGILPWGQSPAEAAATLQQAEG